MDELLDIAGKVIDIYGSCDAVPHRQVIARLRGCDCVIANKRGKPRPDIHVYPGLLGARSDPAHGEFVEDDFMWRTGIFALSEEYPTRLRELLHEPPSVRGWAMILQTLECWPTEEGIEQGIHYVNFHANSWPDVLRVGFKRWYRRAANGDHEPRLAVVKHLDLREIGAAREHWDQLEQFFQRPQTLYIPREDPLRRGYHVWRIAPRPVTHYNRRALRNLLRCIEPGQLSHLSLSCWQYAQSVADILVVPRLASVENLYLELDDPSFLNLSSALSARGARRYERLLLSTHARHLHASSPPSIERLASLYGERMELYSFGRRIDPGSLPS